MTDAVPIPLGWKVILMPKQGKTMSEGGIDVSAASDAEEHLNYIGQILDMGEAAFTARTKSGIDMSAWEARPQIGDFVIYTPYSGMRIRRTGESEESYILLLNDTDIQALIDSPDSYYSWINA
jgi:co-chaperonin GroES (HSP10)